LLKFKYFIFLVAAFYIFNSGCKKESSSIGTHIQPPGDVTKTLYTDTATLLAFTVPGDSITTNNRTLSLLGSCVDPVFGLSTASFLTQFQHTSYIDSFGTGSVADSAVLYLKYSDYYGDVSNQQNVLIYELIKDIYKDSTYYSNKDVKQYYDSTGYKTNFTFYPHPSDDTLAIKLDSAFAVKLIHISHNGLTDNAQFVDEFKGLYLKAGNVSSGGSILYFDLLSAKTKLTLYYHNSTEDSLKYSFVINSNCSRINLFHNNISSIISGSIASFDTSKKVQDSVVYLQPMSGGRSQGGTKVKVCFPFIRNFSKIAINKAELIISKSGYIISPSCFDEPPTQLIALMPSITATPGYSYLPDYIASSTNFDGAYYSDNKYYKLNITMYIQKLTDKSYSNSGIYLFSSDQRISANRVILNSGRKDNAGHMKLLITYTKL
jgi:hypothetical protein